jgi:glycolate oxidase iron-sulfur subunit
MRSVAEGRLPNTSTAFSEHIDRCLGCRACEQVCPAGVEYGVLLEASRQELLAAQPKANLQNRLLRFVLRHVWLSPARLRIMFAGARLFRDLRLTRLLLKTGMARLVSRQAEFGLILLDSSRSSRPEPADTRLQNGKPSEVMSLFRGCVGEGLFGRVNRATRRVLEANSVSINSPENQVCCGALHAHAGDLEGARILARQNIKAFAGDGVIITNAGGCGAMLVSYAHLLSEDEDYRDTAQEFSERVKDVSQELQRRQIRTGTPATNERVTYDTSCHLLYGQHAGESSQKMVQQIPGLDFVALQGTERCCGGAGIYNLMQPEMSSRVLREKLDCIKDTGAELLATGNPGCQMQIAAGACLEGMKLKVCHPIELLDESYARAGFYNQENGG